MIICICRAVSDKKLNEVINSNTTLEDLQIDLGVCLQCGKCKEYIEEILKAKCIEINN
jgi:bacterioferritin-associated ferredoxin